MPKYEIELKEVKVNIKIKVQAEDEQVAKYRAINDVTALANSTGTITIHGNNPATYCLSQNHEIEFNDFLDSIEEVKEDAKV